MTEEKRSKLRSIMDSSYSTIVSFISGSSISKEEIKMDEDSKIHSLIEETSNLSVNIDLKPEDENSETKENAKKIGKKEEDCFNNEAEFERSLENKNGAEFERSLENEIQRLSYLESSIKNSTEDFQKIQNINDFDPVEVESSTESNSKSRIKTLQSLNESLQSDCLKMKSDLRKQIERNEFLNNFYEKKLNEIESFHEFEKAKCEDLREKLKEESNKSKTLSKKIYGLCLIIKKLNFN